MSSLRATKETTALFENSGESLLGNTSLKSVEAEKFASKASVQREKEKMAMKKATAERGSEKGLGFNNTLSALSDSVGDVRVQASALKDFDLLEDLADKNKLSDLQESIFATLTEDSKGKGGSEMDDLFGRKMAPSSSSSSSTIRVVGRQVGKNESEINDLTNSKAFLEKETDDELDFDVFGISKTKQAEKKQQAAAAPKGGDGIQKELNLAGLEDETALDKLEALTIASNTEMAPSRTKTVGAATAAAPVVTDIDMDKLDIDAYISSMSSGGDTDKGGGLFD